MVAAKRKAGRPKGSGQGLTDLVQVRLSPAMRLSTEQAAEAAGVSVAEWMRRAAAYCVAVRVPLRHVSVG